VRVPANRGELLVRDVFREIVAGEFGAIDAPLGTVVDEPLHRERTFALHGRLLDRGILKEIAKRIRGQSEAQPRTPDPDEWLDRLEKGSRDEQSAGRLEEVTAGKRSHAFRM
jgi:hypothetical protein